MKKNKAMEFAATWSGLTTTELSHYSPTVEYPTFNRIVNDHESTGLPWFQRDGGPDGGSGWDKENCQEFVGNVVRGKAQHTIFRAAVGLNILQAKVRGDSESEQFYQEYANRGQKYVSGDGWNGESSIYAFFKQDMPMKDPDTGELILLSEIDEETRNRLLFGPTGTRIITLGNISASDFCNLTRKHNLAVAWTRQEQRRCRPTDLTHHIRKSALKYSGVYNEFCFGDTKAGQDAIKQYGAEEQIAKLFNMIANGYEKNNNPDDLDELYEASESVAVDTKVAARVDHILSVCDNILESALEHAKLKGGKGYKAFGAAKSLALQHFIDVTLQSGLKVRDPLGLFRAWLGVDARLTATARKIMEEEKHDSYIHWLRNSQYPKWYNKIRDAYVVSLRDNEAKWISAGVFYARQRKSDARFSESQRLEIYEKLRQKGNGMDILDVYMVDDIGLMYEADHERSVKDDGPTIVENGNLIPRTENRKKGSRSDDNFLDMPDGV